MNFWWPRNRTIRLFPFNVLSNPLIKIGEKSALPTTPPCSNLPTLIASTLGTSWLLQWAASLIRLHPLTAVPKQELTEGAVEFNNAPVLRTLVNIKVVP